MSQYTVLFYSSLSCTSCTMSTVLVWVSLNTYYLLPSSIKMFNTYLSEKYITVCLINELYFSTFIRYKVSYFCTHFNILQKVC